MKAKELPLAFLNRLISMWSAAVMKFYLNLILIFHQVMSLKLPLSGVERARINQRIKKPRH